MTDEDRIGFDEGRILELMREYRDASTRRERRDIETEVLTETVWQVPELEPNELVVTTDELRTLADELKAGDRTGLYRILQRPFVRLMDE